LLKITVYENIIIIIILLVFLTNKSEKERSNKTSDILKDIEKDNNLLTYYL